MKFSISVGICTLILAAAYLCAGTAAADVWRPGMKAVDGAGFASPDQVFVSVGAESIQVICPAGRFKDELKRGAQVSLEKPGIGYEDPGVLSTILHDALVQIWNQCDTAIGSFGNSVGFVEVYASPSPGSDPVLVVRSDTFFDAWQSWSSITDIGAQQREAAQQAAAQAAADERAAQEAARAQAAAEVAREAQQAAAAETAARQAQIDAERAQRQKETIARWNRVLGWIADLGLIALILAVLVRYRNELAARYYFYFHPHPAALLVKAALGSGTVLDGEALITALNEEPPASSVFRAVRLQQAEELVAAMQNASAAHFRKQEAKSNAKTQTERESAAYHGAHEAVMLAAVALERAKSLHRTSQEVKGPQ